jgi:hypothetical protein
MAQKVAKASSKGGDRVGQKRGRPTTFKPQYIGQARKLCALGHTDLEIAEFFDVSLRTFAYWKARNPELLHALKAGKEFANQRVERSLYQKAVGYSYDSVKIFMPAGAEKPVYAPYVEHVPPDVTACIFWLKNRNPAQWRDAWQVDAAIGKFIISDKPMDEATWIKERALTIDVTPSQDEDDDK